jgi:hypothetical protein
MIYSHFGVLRSDPVTVMFDCHDSYGLRPLRER